MSWLSEEWKEQIPSEAVSYIQEVEEKLEKCQKDLKEYQFKTESLEMDLVNSKQRCEENTGETKQLERQVNVLNADIEKEREKLKTLQASSTNKDNIISDLRKEVDRQKCDLDEHKSLNTKLSSQLDTLEYKQNENNGHKEDDLDRLRELKELNEQRLEELNRKLEMLSKEKQECEKFYEQKLKTLTELNEKQASNMKSLTDNIATLELTIQKVEAENHRLLVEDEKRRNDNSHDETQQHRKEIERLREELDKRKREIEDLKVQMDTHECDIGGYLGIDMQQVCSDTSINEQSPPQVTLLTENKQLQDTNKQLTKTVSQQKQEIESLLMKFNSTGYMLMNNTENTDSTENLVKRTPSAGENERPLSDTEVQRLKEENLRMREVYESHMRVCTQQNTNRLVRKSSSSISNAENEELKKKILMLECSQTELESHLHDKVEECKQLYQEIAKLQTSELSEHAVNKLEDLVDVILQQKGSGSSSNCLTNTTSSTLMSSIDADSLKSIISSSLNVLQEELLSDHELTRDRIKDSTHKILGAIQRSNRGQHQHQESGGSRRRVAVSHCQTPPVGAMINSMDEVELIRERLDHLQRTICARESDFRKVNNDRDHVQEELVKLMELMKKKDEELGRISCLFELEKQKVNENDHCYRAEMEALKVEQLEIYKEFRDMCDNLKKKDIELLNKTKQTKLLNAEWRQKEDAMNERILALERDACAVQTAKDHIENELKTTSNENEVLISRLHQSHDQLRTIFEKMSRIEDLILKAKGNGLYY